MMTLLHGRLTQSEYYAVQQSRMLLQTKKETKKNRQASRELVLFGLTTNQLLQTSHILDCIY